MEYQSKNDFAQALFLILKLKVCDILGANNRTVSDFLFIRLQDIDDVQLRAGGIIFHAAGAEKGSSCEFHSYGGRLSTKLVMGQKTYLASRNTKAK